MLYYKRVLFVFLCLISTFVEAQSLVQIFTDRCTGETKVFTVEMNGSTVITFYDQSRVFTASDFRSGALQSWLEGVYAAYAALSPCSQTQAETNATQQAVNESAKAASQAASQAASSPPPNTNTNANTNQTPPANDPPPDTSSSSANQNTGDQGGNTSTGGGDSQADGSQGSGGSSDSQGSESDSNAETGSTEDSSSSAEESSQAQEESSSSSENSDDSGAEGESEDASDDSSDGEGGEESEESESESEVEEEESKEEESKEEEKEEKKEEKKKKKKKRNSNPPIIVANISSMQNIDGRFQQAMTLGLSKTSLRGDKSYALTSMVWQNLKQYMLMGTFSKIFFVKGRPKFIYSAGIGASKMFTTLIFMNNHSVVYMGNKGGVYGLSLGANLIYLDYEFKKASLYVDDALLSGAVTMFATKPYNFDRYNISPMVAVSNSFISYGPFNKTTSHNKDLMIITGLNTDYALTKRFKVNLGVNAISNTNKDVPTLWNITIGSRFQF